MRKGAAGRHSKRDTDAGKDILSVSGFLFLFLIHRRQFLMGAAAVTASAALPPPSMAVLRANDGRVLQSSGDAETWIAPPGSTVKPFVIARLLRTGRLKPRETYLCTGKHRIAGRDFTCSHPAGLPPLDPARMLAYSCNGGVAHFAERFAPGELASALREAGFRAGGAGDVRLQALGEEGVWTTALELARAYRRLALQQDPVILEGLEGAVRYGTGRAADVAGISVAGKTGSAMAGDGLHAAWFAGFAPSRSPEFVLAIGIQGRSGGSDAAPVAAQTFTRYFARAGEFYRVRVQDRILTVNPEEYVAGVLAGESSVFHQREALQAMAVAARTYAAHERGRHKGEGFDFCNTTHCQRFQQSVADTRLIAAARATAGQMIRFDSQVAFTPYTMSCGGTSEAAHEVWRDVEAPWLRVRHDPFCSVETWGCHLTAADVQRALRSAGLNCPAALHSVAVARRTASGRAATLILAGDEQVRIDAGAFRFAVGRALGWNLIRSNWFDTSGSFDLNGRGEGHGVGLCQRGAEAMAARGFGYREILAFYFPGTTALNWLRLGGESVAVYGTDANRDAAALSEAERLVKKLPWPLRSSPAIYVYPDVDTFRAETGEPGWVAAHTAGARIDLQPVNVLRQHGALRETVHHELLHVTMEQHAAPNLPLWFREGLVEYLSGSAGKTAGLPADADIRGRGDRAKAVAAYAEAAAEVEKLVNRYGQETVLAWVSAGVPATVTNSRNKIHATNNK